MKHISIHDDLRLAIKAIAGNGGVIRLQDYNFTLTYFTRRYDRRVIKYDSSTAMPEGFVFNNDGSVQFCVDKPRLIPGEIMLEIIIDFPNSSFSDRKYRVSSGVIHTEIVVEKNPLPQYSAFLAPIEPVVVVFFRNATTPGDSSDNNEFLSQSDLDAILNGTYTPGTLDANALNAAELDEILT